MNEEVNNNEVKDEVKPQESVDGLDIPGFVKKDEENHIEEDHSDEQVEADAIEEQVEQEEFKEDEYDDKPHKTNIVLPVLILALGIAIIAMGWNILTANKKDSEVDVQPTEAPIVEVVETPTPTPSVETTKEPEATVSPTEEADKGGEATATPEASAESTDEPIIYKEGDGPQGSAGRIYNADGTSYAVNYHGDKASVQGKTTYRTTENMLIVPDADYSYSVGSTLTWVDEYGYAYDYQCTQMYKVHKDSNNGIYKLSDGTEIDNANYGSIAIISNGNVAFFEIIG